VSSLFSSAVSPLQHGLIKNLQTQIMAQSHYINALSKELGEAKAKSVTQKEKLKLI